MVNLIFRPEVINHTVSRGNGVIKAVEFSALEEAHTVLQTARDNAVQIAASAQAHYRDEKERGYREGRESADKEALARLLADHDHLDRKLQAMERDLADLVKSSIRKILAVFEDCALVETVLHQALQKLRRDSRLQIYLPPYLGPSFAAITAKIEAKFPSFQSIEILEDSSLNQHSFVLESTTNRIECDLGHMLGEVDQLIDQTAANIAHSDLKRPQFAETTQ
ncbi:hypothetical protein PDO_5010 [Rhizobium sp. PDO1-076]|uniref:hypothetical protein n=1 Tax=Rhizobium sp. PDO1-076 TaxID=1125979 RepID=UPI00024E25A4|nr:hypothetical protein [Rhizobium sp. PDO1-076]EHS51854.1 hypothetical protein PDO_5010 [Rhizobium sp. PDO1-076]